LDRDILNRLKSESNIKNDLVVVPFKSIKAASKQGIPEKTLEIMLLEEALSLKGTRETSEPSAFQGNFGY